jgi:hypothetical protein
VDGTVAVTDRMGRRVDKQNVGLAEGDKKLQTELEGLLSGTYTVEWKALSTDGHTMKGKFTFTLALEEAAAAAPSTTPSGSQIVAQHFQHVGGLPDTDSVKLARGLTVAALSRTPLRTGEPLSGGSV